MASELLLMCGNFRPPPNRSRSVTAYGNTQSMCKLAGRRVHTAPQSIASLVKPQWTHNPYIHTVALPASSIRRQPWHKLYGLCHNVDTSCTNMCYLASCRYPRWITPATTLMTAYAVTPIIVPHSVDLDNSGPLSEARAWLGWPQASSSG